MLPTPCNLVKFKAGPRKLDIILVRFETPIIVPETAVERYAADGRLFLVQQITRQSRDRPQQSGMLRY